MSKLFFVFVFISSGLLAQTNFGYIIFEAEEKWVIEINDSLIQSAKVNKLPSGSYKFKARPQISYNWPAIFIEDTLQVSADDTLIYVLSVEKSNTSASIDQNRPKVTSYSEKGYKPSPMKRTNLKSGLLISAIAANWLSFYLKRQADDNYKKYRSASNLSKINNFYDKSQQFDNYSSVLLGVSVAALSGYIYFTLTE